MSNCIQREIGGDGVALLTIDVDGRSMNVVTAQFIADLAEAAEWLATDSAVRGAIVTSAKGEFFAGADLNDLLALMDSAPGVAEIYAIVRPFSDALRRLETTGKPVAAAINGTALGSGLEICLACHHRVATDRPGAVFGLPEVKLGLLPGAGGTQRLPRLIGVEKALRLMVEGQHLRATEALQAGVLDKVVSADQLLAAARAWVLAHPRVDQPWDRNGFRIPGGGGAMDARSAGHFIGANALVAGTTRHNYPAPQAILSCVYEGTIVPLDVGLAIESRYLTNLLRGPVAANMVRTLFVNKGAADKLVRRPDAIEPRPVSRVGVVGGGMMGAGIAYVSAAAGLTVTLLDITEDNAERGRDYIRRRLDQAVTGHRLRADRAADTLARIRPTTDYHDLATADLIVEAVFEHRDTKIQVTQRIEAVADASSLIASSTSTLPITALAESCARPDRFIGLHFFSPVDQMPLVEVIVGQQTSQQTIAHALDYVRQIRKTPILVNDSRGFFAGRVFGTYTNEGLTLLAEGVAPALIENAGRLAGMPVGPLAVTDDRSIELAHKLIEQTRHDMGDAFRPPSGAPVIYRFHDEFKRLGKRYGRGIYDYPADQPKRLWSGLASAYPLAAVQPNKDQVIKRLLTIQALESARCLEEGVVTHAADADIGSVFGWGFPPWTGGTASYIDMIGMAAFVADCDYLAERHGPRYAVSDGLRDRAAAGRSLR